MNDMPWFPFYVADFMNSRKVKLMSDANVGRYVKLLCEQWEHGPLPKEIDELANLLGLDPITMRNEWSVLGRCFVETDGGYVNERLEEVRDKQKAKAERLSRAGRIAGKKSGEARRRKSNRRTKNERSLNDGPTVVERFANHSESDTDTEGGSTGIQSSSSKETHRGKRLADFAHEIGRLCTDHDCDWKLKASIDDWADQIARTPKYAGIDFAEETRKANEYHQAEGTDMKSPDRTLRNWLDMAVKIREKERNGRSGYNRDPTMMSADELRNWGKEGAA